MVLVLFMIIVIMFRGASCMWWSEEHSYSAVSEQVDFQIEVNIQSSHSLTYACYIKLSLALIKIDSSVY